MSSSVVLMGKSVISVFIEESVKEKLKAMSDEEKRSMSQMASILIAEAITNRENLPNEKRDRDK